MLLCFSDPNFRYLGVAGEKNNLRETKTSDQVICLSDKFPGTDGKNTSYQIAIRPSF